MQHGRRLRTYVPPMARGLITLSDILADGQWVKLFEQPNLIPYTWGSIAAHAIGFGDSTHVVSAMYIEYKNVASPFDTITIPTYDRSTGGDLGYYRSLPGDQDYLRVPLAAQPLLTIASGFAPYFATDDGNQLTFLAQTSAILGENGLTFDNSANSKVFGVALVATPNWNDSSHDIIMARSYFATGNQRVKPINAQLGVTWQMAFV